MISIRFVNIIFITLLTFMTWEVDGAMTPQRSQLSFNYTKAELSTIKMLPVPEEQITVESFDEISKEVNYLIDSANLNGMDQTILPAYLAEAQKEFAWLSYLLTGKFSGNLGPITNWILQLFIPKVSLSTINDSKFDLYSSAISVLVMDRLVKRLNKERLNIHDYPKKYGKDKWTPTSPGYVGLNFGSMQTWFLNSSKQFVADEPPKSDIFWRDQCLDIVQAQEKRGATETEAVFKWAGLTGIGSGDWHYITTNYLKKKNVPIADQLYIRAVLFCALADSNAAAFHSKYTYWIKRPSQYMDRVKPLITIPNHPSYPSAHSTIGATAAEVLTHFFPEEKQTWNQLAEEAGVSRIWGGIHYPIDHKNGVELGKKVGQWTLRTLNKSGNQKF